MELLSLNKPVRAADGKKTAFHLTDGNAHTRWEASQYPAIAQVDLQCIAMLKSISVFTPAKGYTQYSVYASEDGIDFYRLLRKRTKDACPPGGERYEVEGKARYVRLVLEYASHGTKAAAEQLQVRGIPVEAGLRDPAPVQVPDFEDTPFSLPVNTHETLRAVEGVIRRTLGDMYLSWFELKLQPNARNPLQDHFLLEDGESRVRVSGNNGVSLAAGVNHYLKYFCHVHVAQVGSQLQMPKEPPKVGKAVRRETPFPVRYAYNYCTHAYTMAFWGEAEWQRELDWLALNGVNLVLDITGWEEVWRRFLTALGYSHTELKDFIAGPAYAPWALMANLSGFGGPVHDSRFLEQTRLARKNHRFLRAMGMQPILQGYNGMVPADIREKQPGIQIIPQGKWNAFQRPAIVKTTSPDYVRLARLFYRCQKKVYGDVTRYYAADLFHEGGFPGLMKQADVSAAVMRGLREFQKDAVWVIQSWEKNPTKEMLQGLELAREHTLILDLQAEVQPRWETWDGGEFHNSPWVYCMLNNFGGRMGLYGHMETFVREIPRAAREAPLMQGIGITPEATMENPVLYDLFFETAWMEEPGQPTAIHLDDWLRDYTHRRYGVRSGPASRAMRLLAHSVYDCKTRGDGAPETIINARPTLFPEHAFSHGHTMSTQEEGPVMEAARLLLGDYDRLEGSDGYLYDLTDVLRQVLSYRAYHAQRLMASALARREKNAYQKESQRFLRAVTLMERLLSTRKEFLLGSWLDQARKAAARADEFTEDWYLWTAKALITTWGSKEQSETGRLHDYSNRQWAGLTGSFYLKRWECFIAREKERLSREGAPHTDWFRLEWGWVRQEKRFSSVPSGESLKALGKEVLEF